MNNSVRGIILAVAVSAIAMAIFRYGFSRDYPVKDEMQSARDSNQPNTPHSATDIAKGLDPAKPDAAIRPIDPKATSLSLDSGEAIAAVTLGLRLPPGYTLARFVTELDAEVRAGSIERAVEFSRLLSTCSTFRSRGELASGDKEAAWQETVSDVCSTLGDSPNEDAALLVAAAARAGDHRAIIEEWYYPPAGAAEDPHVSSWVEGAFARLERLADSGNLDAIFLAARQHQLKSFGAGSSIRASHYLRQFLVKAPQSHPNYSTAMAMQEAICKHHAGDPSFTHCVNGD